MKPAAVLVHGSFGAGTDTFRHQLTLGDELDLRFLERRSDDGWPSDSRALVDLLDELGEAHLVGQSYGAVVALLAAGRRPERVRSLVAIEPPAFEHAAGDPDADAATASLRPIYEQPPATAREFVRAWRVGRGATEEQAEAWMADWSDADWQAAEAARRERWPGDAPFDFDTLGAARFPKVFVRGGWPGAEHNGRAFWIVCERLADRTGGELVVFEGSAHNPQLEEPERFNDLLRRVWRSAPPA